MLVSLLACMTGQEKCCALVDACDGFDPGVAEAAGLDLTRLLWVRCHSNKPTAAKAHAAITSATQQSSSRQNARQHDRRKVQQHDRGGQKLKQYRQGEMSRQDWEEETSEHYWAEETKQDKEKGPSARELDKTLGRETLKAEAGVKHSLKPLEQALKAADILVQNGGFGLIVVDLSEIEERLVRKVPLSTWFRFARVVEKKSTALVFLTSYPGAQSCATLTLYLPCAEANWAALGEAGHTRLVAQLQCEAEVGRAPFRKAAQSAKTKFSSTALWA
jgi:hypothetical protein